MKLNFSWWLWVLHVVSVTGGAADIEDLFIVDKGTCGDLLSSGKLQQWADESLAMASAAQNLFNIPYNRVQENPPIASAYFQGLMNLEIKPPPSPGGYSGDHSTEDAKTVLSRAVDFLATAEVPANGQTKAYLLCSDSVFEQVDPKSYALQKDGKSVQTNKHGQRLTVEEAYANDFEGTSKRTIAYFVKASGLNQYFFQQVSAYNVFTSTQKPCLGKFNAGETFDARLYNDKGAQSVVLLCPDSFIFKAEHETLGTIKPRPAGTIGPALQRLQTILPESNTLLHEVFHYASYPARDIVDNAYFVGSCQRLPTEKATHNAQSYAYVAVGAWYTANKQVNGRTITYASGGCRYVR